MATALRNGMNVEAEDEAAKVKAAQQDPAAFEHLYMDYADPVFRYLYSRVGYRAEAEDLTAQTFLAALESLPRYKDQGHFAAWLFSIARNKAMDYFRRQRSQPSLDEIDEAGIADQVDDPPDNERAAALLEQIALLPEDQRDLLRLRFVAELSFDEMAEVLKRNRETVKKSFYRLCARLQEQVEGSHD